MFINQTLVIDGLPKTPLPGQMWNSLKRSYEVTFPELLEMSDVIFGNATVSLSKNSDVESFTSESESGNFQYSIPVRIRAPPKEAYFVVMGLGQTAFAENVAIWLETPVTIIEQNATGMEILFSVKQPHTSDIAAAITDNPGCLRDTSDRGQYY